MTKEEGKFTIIDDNGNKTECETLFTFENEKTHKNYIVYTDNTKDEQGNTKVYASIYDPKNLEGSLAPLETDEEWQTIEKLLERMKKDILNGIEDVDELEDGLEKELTSDDKIEIQNWIDELSPFESDQPMDDSTFKEFLIEKSNIISDVKDDSEKLSGLLDDIFWRLMSEQDTSRINSLFDLISKIDGVSSSYYSNFAMLAYEKHNFSVSEMAFRRAVELCDDESCLSYKNNLAYLIRRGEIRKPEERSIKEVISLLREGIEKKDTFSLINMALLWALEFGKENDWKMADNLVRLVDRNKSADASQWWFDVAKAGEAEGFLVHLLLIRHGKIKNSQLGNIETLYNRVKIDYPRIPVYLKNIVTPF